jgi:protein TonB
MEVKKNPKVDLENYRSILLEIGLIVALVSTYLVFQIRSADKQENVLGDIGEVKVEEEIIPITRTKEVKPPPPPPPKVVEQLNIVENDADLEEEFEMDNSEADESTVVDQNTDIQVEEEADDEPINFYIVEEKPEFPGGEAALYKYLAENTKYPEAAMENQIQGTVWVQFIIDKEGNVTNVKVVRSVDPYLDKEAIRVVKSMPKWKPAKQRGKPVRVIFQVPIKFVLAE